MLPTPGSLTPWGHYPTPSPSPNPNPNPSPNPNQVNKHFMLEDPEDLDVDWLEAKIAGKH